jgi:hypothetical protein
MGITILRRWPGLVCGLGGVHTAQAVVLIGKSQGPRWQFYPQLACDNDEAGAFVVMLHCSNQAVTQQGKTMFSDLLWVQRTVILIEVSVIIEDIFMWQQCNIFMSNAESSFWRAISFGDDIFM